MNAVGQGIYVSHNGNDANAGSAAGQAIQSITRLNQLLSTGPTITNIYFERGGSYFGAIELPYGSITLTSYGSGPNPIITGKQAITGWVNTGGNIWRASCADCPSNLNAVFLDDQMLYMGRYPNQSTNSNGFFTITSAVADTVISTSSLPGSWVGADAMVRANRWTWQRQRIKAQSGATLTLEKINNSYNFLVDYGFFIQNHFNTLDTDREWYFDNSTNDLYMYSNTDPNTLNLSVPVLDTLLYNNGLGFIVLDSLTLTHANKNLFVATSATDNQILNCTLKCCASTAIRTYLTHNLQVVNNQIHDLGEYGAFIVYSNDYLIEGNTFKRLGIHPVNTQYGTPQAMNLRGNNYVVRRNVIDSIGYVGIGYDGSNLLFEENEISNFCLSLDDGGAFHTWAPDTVEDEFNRIIRKNIIRNGIGLSAATNKPEYTYCVGLYVDDRSYNIKMDSNVIYNCPASGIFLHNSRKCRIKGNLVVNCGTTQLEFLHDNYLSLRYDTVVGNTFVNGGGDQCFLMFRTARNDLDSLGLMQDNTWVTTSYADKAVHIRHAPDFPTKTTKVVKYMSVDDFISSFPYGSNYQTTPIYYDSPITYGSNEITNPDLDVDDSGWRYFVSGGNGFKNLVSVPGMAGNALKSEFFSFPGGTYSQTHHEVSPSNVRQWYKFSAKIKGHHAGQRVRWIGRNRFAPYNPLFGSVDQVIDTGLHYHTTYAVASDSITTPVVGVELQETDVMAIIDSVVLQRVYFQYDTNRIKFLYNATDTSKQVTLSKQYLGTDSTLYAIGSKLNLAPYSGKVLLEDTNLVVLFLGVNLNGHTKNNKAHLSFWHRYNDVERLRLLKWWGGQAEQFQTIELPTNATTYTDDYFEGRARYQLEVTTREAGKQYSNQIYLSGGYLTNFSVWPNPTYGPINLKLNTELRQASGILQIYSTSGVLLANQAGSGIALEQALQKTVPTLTKGTYLIKVISGGEVRVKKLIKQ